MSDTKGKSTGFSDFERNAMKERAKELRAEAKVAKNRAEGLKVVMEAIAALPEPDKTLGNKIHEIITKTAPELMPKTWYGMPAYCMDEKVVVFFKAASKYESRYAMLGFEDKANLDEGNMWPVVYGIKDLSAAEESKIVELIKKAVN